MNVTVKLPRHSVGQMFLMDKFFDGDFIKFGLQVLEYMQEDQEDRIDPMIYIFPRMTKCTFFKYGVSGEVIKNLLYSLVSLSLICIFNCRWKDMMRFAFCH